MGTTLPMPASYEDSVIWDSLIIKRWNNASGRWTRYWTPYTDLFSEGYWVNFDLTDVKDIPWDEGEPNGITYENCGFLRPGGVYDGDCLNNVQCAVCGFEEQPIFRMIGICERELRNVHYISSQPNLGDL